ncbi:hypothetical protein PR048_025692 [Dryococelus australis]|uniref:Uncharacterized protein n=1 Tax=Dryococelus australis TaxID=614101 RepID=A0ABQ9GJ57_9NEOP|nr:hypothetical protein PR048_025692 [Dryococelus australis]
MVNAFWKALEKCSFYREQPIAGMRADESVGTPSRPVVPLSTNCFLPRGPTLVQIASPKLQRRYYSIGSSRGMKAPPLPLWLPCLPCDRNVTIQISGIRVVDDSSAQLNAHKTQSLDSNPPSPAEWVLEARATRTRRCGKLGLWMLKKYRYIENKRQPRLFSGFKGAAVAERIACSSPTKANRVQSPAGSLTDLRTWESCRAMLLVDGFFSGISILTSFATSSLGHSLSSRRQT